jgi:hypothetical protein
VPVTVTVNVPALPEHDSVEVLDVPKVRLVGESVQVNPVTGDTVDVRAMAPVKP